MGKSKTVSASRTFNAFIESLSLSIKKALEKGGTIEDMTEIALKEISFLNSGINIYFPKTIKVRMRSDEIKQGIIKDFNGNNHNQLAVKYDVSVQWVYKVLREK